MTRFTKRSLPAACAWGGLLAYVLAVDTGLIAGQFATLSEVFSEAVGHPVKKYPVILAWGVLTFHLFTPPDNMVKRADPLHHIANVGRKLAVRD